MRKYDPSASSYEVGFEVGFDICRYGLFLEEYEQHDEALKNGFDSARTQNVSRIKPDKFEKKLLQIRRRAFRKGIPVSITTQDIKNALSLTDGQCPVLNEVLTFNTGGDSDWSVDRLDNEQGYDPDNIFIMSSEANKAKGDVSLEDILLYIMNLDDNLLSRQPRLGMYEKAFWQNLYLAIFERMPLQMFCRKAHEFLSHDSHTINLRDQVLLEIITSAMDEDAEPLSINSYHQELRDSELIGSVLPAGIFSRADLVKLRKSALKVINKITFVMSSTDDFPAGKGLQDMFCDEFVANERNASFVSKIEHMVKKVTENPSNCGLILGIMTQRHREYEF